MSSVRYLTRRRSEYDSNISSIRNEPFRNSGFQLPSYFSSKHYVVDLEDIVMRETNEIILKKEDTCAKRLVDLFFRLKKMATQFVIFFLYFLVGYLVYSHYEGWNFLDSAYFIINTFSTVGCSNFTPQSYSGKLFTIFHCFIGLATVYTIMTSFRLRRMKLVENFITKCVICVDHKKLHPATKFCIELLHFTFLFTMVSSIGALYPYLSSRSWTYSDDSSNPLPWTYIDSVYWCVTTMTGVGYGDLIIPRGDPEVFGILYIWFTLTLSQQAIERWASFFVLHDLVKKDQPHRLQLTSKYLQKFNAEKGYVTLLEFIVGALTYGDLVDKEYDIDPILEKFASLDNGSGVLDADDFRFKKHSSISHIDLQPLETKSENHTSIWWVIFKDIIDIFVSHICSTKSASYNNIASDSKETVNKVDDRVIVDHVDDHFSLPMTDFSDTASSKKTTEATATPSTDSANSTSVTKLIIGFLFKHESSVFYFLMIVTWYLIGYAYYSQTENWSFSQCMFYSTSTITTVGFSLYVPTKQDTRVFTIFYILVGMVLEYIVIIYLMTSIFRAYENKLIGRSKKDRIRAISFLVYEVIASALGLLLLSFLGAIYYSETQNPGEYTFFQSFYFSVLVVSNVGYMDYSISEGESENFTTAYMIIVVILAQYCLEKIGFVFYEIYDMIRRDNLQQIKITSKLLKSFNICGFITPIDFLVGMLCYDCKIDRTDDIEPLLRLFQKFDVQNNGTISVQDLETMYKLQDEVIDEVSYTGRNLFSVIKHDFKSRADSNSEEPRLEMLATYLSPAQYNFLGGESPLLCT